MTPSRVKMAELIIHRISWWYARRVWWADVKDLMQEAWVTAMECDLEMSDDHFRGYVWRAVSKRLSRYCWEQSCPVSCSKAGPHLGELFRAQVSPSMEESGNDPEMEMLSREAGMLIPHFQDQLRKRIVQLYDRESRVSSPNPVIAGVVLILVDGVKPNAAAVEAGADIQEIYRTTEWVKKRATEDRVVQVLLANIKDRRRDL